MKSFFTSLLLLVVLSISCSKNEQPAKIDDPNKPDAAISKAYAQFAGTWRMTYLKCSEACGPVELPLSRDWVLTLDKDGGYTFKDDGKVTISRKYTIKQIGDQYIMDDVDEIKIDESGVLVISTTSLGKPSGPSSAVKKYVRLQTN